MLSLKAFLGLDASGYALEMKRVESLTKKFTNSIAKEVTGKIGGLFTVGAIAYGTKAIIDYGSQINDLSLRLGVSTDALQKWDYALRLNGGTIESATHFFEKLAEAREKALGGDSKAMGAFSAFGVTQDDLHSKRLEDLGSQIGSAFQGGDQQKLMSSLREIGGRGAGELAAAFKDGLGEAFKNAELLNKVIPPETIAALDQAGDAFTSFATTLKVIFAPAISFVARLAQNFVGSIGAMVSVSKAFLTELPKTGFFGAALAGQSAMDAENKKWSDELRKLREDTEKAKNGGAVGGGGSPTEKQEPLVKENYEDFFTQSKKGSSLNINSMQQMGALIQAGSPLQNEMSKMTSELHAVGLTLKEFNNYAKQIGKAAPGFDGGSDGALQGKGVNF